MKIKLQKLFRASLLYGDTIVKDKFFESYEDAESWANYQLKMAWDKNPGFTNWYEVVIIESEGVIL